MPSSDSRASTSWARSGSVMIVSSVSSSASTPSGASQRVQQLGDVVREAHVEQRRGGGVHRHGDVQPVLAPCALGAQRLVDHLERQQPAEAGALDERHELGRRDEAALGVLPAHEGLRAEDPAGAQARLGLEVQDELAVA